MVRFSEICSDNNGKIECEESKYPTLLNEYCDDIFSDDCQNAINNAPSFRSIQKSKYSKDIFDALTKEQMQLIESREEAPKISNVAIKYFAFTLFAISTVVFILYLIIFNTLSIDNRAKIIVLFGIGCVMIGSFNFGFDIARFRSHSVPDYGVFDIWTAAHIMRDIFFFILVDYYVNNAWISFAIIMAVAVGFELLESLWDKESIGNKLSDLVMVIVGSIIGYIIFLFF